MANEEMKVEQEQPKTKAQEKAEATVERVTSNSETTIKIGVIGIGNGGSQAALAASNHGHNTLVLNTSVKDLNDRVLSKDMKALRIGDGRGSGKDRSNAMALLNMNGKEGIRKIFTNPYFKSVVEPADVVFVAFSTGGGTGSGIGPHIASMIKKAYRGKLVIPYGIIPKTAESVMAQANTIACVDDMVQTGCPYMLADLDFWKDEPMEVAYERVGEYVATTFDIIRGDYLKMSTAGMADERDMMTVISEPGYMAIHRISGLTESDLEKKTMQGFLLDAIRKSPAVRPQRDKLIGYNCIICNVNSAFDDPLKAGDYSELNGVIGEPKATFGNYAIDDTRAEAEVISIMSGLTIPMDRFVTARAKVEANKANYEKQSALSLSKDRDLATFQKDDTTSGIIMGSSSSTKADLSFLD